MDLIVVEIMRGNLPAEASGFLDMQTLAMTALCSGYCFHKFYFRNLLRGKTRGSNAKEGANSPFPLILRSWRLGQAVRLVRFSE
jgi:hypothetical protein